MGCGNNRYVVRGLRTVYEALYARNSLIIYNGWYHPIVWELDDVKIKEKYNGKKMQMR